MHQETKFGPRLGPALCLFEFYFMLIGMPCQMKSPSYKRWWVGIQTYKLSDPIHPINQTRHFLDCYNRAEQRCGLILGLFFFWWIIKANIIKNGQLRECCMNLASPSKRRYLRLRLAAEETARSAASALAIFFVSSSTSFSILAPKLWVSWVNA